MNHGRSLSSSMRLVLDGTSASPQGLLLKPHALPSVAVPRCYRLEDQFWNRYRSTQAATERFRLICSGNGGGTFWAYSLGAPKK